MPWDAKSFASRHNKKLTGPAAKEAAKQATGMVKAGVPEGIAIATANKRGDKLEAKQARTSASAPRSADEHMAQRKAQGLSHREVGAEFGKPKSTAHRKMANIMRTGYIGQGSAR